MTHWEGYRSVVNQTYRDTTTGSRKSGPSPFSELWSPPNEDSPLLAEWIRFFPGHYSVCPVCNQVVALSATEETKCWNCTAAIFGLVDMPVFPNYNLFVPGAGPRHKGWTVACRCYLGNVKHITEGEPQPKKCVLCWVSKEHYDRVRDNYRKQFGDQVKPPKEVWREAFQKHPRMHTAHNLIRLGFFHQVQEAPKKQGDKPRVGWEPCTQGMIGHSGRPMDCKMCEAGVARKWGRRGYWNPTEPMADRGHLHRLRRYEQSKLSGRCNSCGKGTIVVASYECPNCKKEALNCYADGVTDEDIRRAAKGEMVCPHCGFGDKDKGEHLQEEIQCTHQGDGTLYEGCDSPARTTIFDTNLLICSRGTGFDSELNIEDHNFDPFPEEHIEEFIQPIDFRFLADIKTSTQAKYLHIDDPYTGEGAPRGASAVSEYE